MSTKNKDLVSIVKEFAESGWDLIDAPAQSWLDAKDDTEKLKIATTALVTALKQADTECGSCGCEMDPLYQKALGFLAA